MRTSLILTLFFALSDAARILFHISTPTHSHNIVYAPIVHELAKKHEIVVITPVLIYKNGNSNVTEIDTGACLPYWKSVFDKPFIRHSPVKNHILYLNVMNQVNDLQLSVPEVAEMIHNPNEHFDLVVIESIAYYPSLGWSYRFNAPMIGVASLDFTQDLHDLMGNIYHPYLFRSYLMESTFGPDISFMERMYAIYAGLATGITNYVYKRTEAARVLRKHFGEEVPSLSELEDNFNLIFLNQNEVLNKRPKVATIVYMDMLHIQPTKPLPEVIHEFLENATEGAIYFSMGSNVKSSSMSKEKLDIFTEAFAQLPYKVLWKFEKKEFPGRLPENVRLCQWCPQQDILAHRNVKLFIMQGGLQSLEESIYHSVPILGIPILGDQKMNLNLLKERSVAEYLMFDNLKTADLIAHIHAMINDKSYKTRMDKLSWQIRDQLTKPLDRVIWWFEYVLRHGDAKHLRPHALPWYLYYMLDAWAAALLIFILARRLIRTLSKLVRKYISPRLSSKKIKAH